VLREIPTCPEALQFWVISRNKGVGNLIMTSSSNPLAPTQISAPEVFTLGDGRRLTYQHIGDLQGQPVFFFHGSPGSRLESLSAQAAAIQHHWHIIAPDRPGMGQSDFKPGYTLLDYTNDIQELADGLGLDTFGIMGHSGGGVTVLSCAYTLPERLNFALDLGGSGNDTRTQDSNDRPRPLFCGTVCAPTIAQSPKHHTVPLSASLHPIGASSESSASSHLYLFVASVPVLL